MLEKYKNDFFRDLTTFGSSYFYMFILILLLLFKEIRLFKILVIGFVVTYLISFFIRIFYFKQRPKKENYTNLITKIDASSFPSVHSMRAIFIAIIFAKHFNNFYISTFLIAWSLLVAYSRVYIKKHYWLDIVAGLTIGLILALLLNRL